MVSIPMLVSGVVLLALGVATTAFPDAAYEALTPHSRRDGRPTRGVGVWSVRLGGAGAAAFGAFSVYGAFAYA